MRKNFRNKNSNFSLKQNSIHPTAIIGPNVKIGSGNIIGPNCLILGNVSIGDRNWFGPNVVVGTPPDWQGLVHDEIWSTGYSLPIIIGSRNVIREFSVIHHPTAIETTIGNDCYIMTRNYLSHDVKIGNEVKLAAGVLLAGFCQVDEKAYLGMGSMVHQKIYIGAGTMIGMGSTVTKHVPPLAKIYGNPAKVKNLNSVRLKDFSFNDTEAKLLLEAYQAGKLPNLKEFSINSLSVFKTYLQKTKESD